MGFNTNLLKEIWLKHIEVQERVLQLNSAPITIEPELTQILGQRLRVCVCQTEELDSKLAKIKSFFKVTDEAIDTNNGVILCDSHFDVDVPSLSNLIEECIKYYIQISKYPIIEGVIRSQKSTFSKLVKTL